MIMKTKKKIDVALSDLTGKSIGTAIITQEYEKLPSDNFVYLYDGKGLDLVKSTGSAATLKVFFALSFSLHGGDSFVYISPLEREKIMSDYGISEGSFCAALKELEEKNIILRGKIVDMTTGEIKKQLRRGQFIMNPSASGKGSSEDRKVMIDTYENLVLFSKGKK